MPSTYVTWRLARALGVPITELVESDAPDVVQRIRILLEDRSRKQADRALRVLTEMLK